MSEPTGPVRDSSLGINKAPGKCYSCREAQIAVANIGVLPAARQCDLRPPICGLAPALPHP